jgi:hypothetical protein
MLRGAFNQPGRGLVVGVVDTPEGAQLRGLDVRQARRRLAKAAPGSALAIPCAYELDDLTLGVLWSVANYDAALTDDNGLVLDARDQMQAYEALRQSSVAQGPTNDLWPVSEMWLGSDFCARHILCHTTALADVPVFWPKEQRGEEASAWLLFGHKYDYLQALSEQYAGAPMQRAFCVPAVAIASSPKSERVLFVLAAALMESFGISIAVTTDPEYAGIEGFVYDRKGNAILATWVGSQGLWNVDVVDSRPAVRDYAEATYHARTASITPASSPGIRLRQLAEYLEVDWPWLTQRCAVLADFGCAGLAEPRSPLLSTKGLDRACDFVGQLDAS